MADIWTISRGFLGSIFGLRAMILFLFMFVGEGINCQGRDSKIEGF